MRNHWTEIEKYLEDQKIAQELIGELRDFHMRYEVEDQVKERVEKPDILFYGKKILEMSIAALLQGDNESYRKKCTMRDTGMDIRKTGIRHFFSCKYRQCRSDWNGYLYK